MVNFRCVGTKDGTLDSRYDYLGIFSLKPRAFVKRRLLGLLENDDWMINKTFVFKLLVSDQNVANQSDNFKVLKAYKRNSEKDAIDAQSGNAGKKGAVREIERFAPQTPQKRKR
ncbi:hypothetical protein MKW98_003269 [Papaver atlanticum]|uniref:Uncharacterized protein n=1 Tax=Papaver atlanticum TaxID=357466 RepID=A0AAD4XRG1_9MAGN|nr:hypothetical protein MKW98_003269 [Papaver atlanticum]